MRYRTKPCEIEAIQWTGFNLKELQEFVDNDSLTYVKRGITLPAIVPPDIDIFINTLEGVIQASRGDYIIKGLRGEFYPCKPDVFDKKYKLIE